MTTQHTKKRRPVQVKIWSKFERVTEERIERNRRGRAMCQAAIEAAVKKRRAET